MPFRAGNTTCLLLGAILISCAPNESEESPPPPLALHAERGDETRVLPIRPGDTIEVAGRRMDVSDIRPWRGLLKQQTGIALLHFALRPQGERWIDDLVLKDGDRLTLNEGLAIEFYWAADPTAHRAVDRWGVRENGRTSWSESFIPGTAFVLEDGSVVTLTERTAVGAIRVSVEVGGQRETLSIDPGTEHDTGIINATTPMVSTRLLCRTQSDGTLSITTDRSDSTAPIDLVRGESIVIAGVEFRFLDAQADAVYVDPAASPWLEAVLEVNEPSGGMVRIREGTVQRLDDWRLRVERPEPAE